MMKRFVIAAVVATLVLAAACAHVITPATDAPRISLEDARKLIADPGTAFIDVRYGKDWEGSDRKIAGAVREDPGNLKGWAGNYPKDKTLILYCA